MSKQEDIARLRQRVRSGRENKEFIEADIPRAHHNLMVVYGWIPLDEFKKLSLPTFFA